MRCWWCVLVLLGALACPGLVGGQTVPPRAWRLQAPLTGTLQPDTPARVPLSRQVIAATSRQFADLRLLDDTGRETPYVIYAQHEPARTQRTFPLTILRQESQGEEILLFLERPKDVGALHGLLVQTTTPDFHYTVRVQSSQDQHSWREVTTDALFAFTARPDVRNTTLILPAVEAPYLRLILQDAASPGVHNAAMRQQYTDLAFAVLGDNRPALRIDQVTGYTEAAHASAPTHDGLVIPHPRTTTDAEGDTRFHLGEVRLPVDALTLLVENPYYYRQVEIEAADTDHDDAYRVVATGAVYRLPGMLRTANTVHVAQPQHAYLRLKVRNGGSPPLRMEQAYLAWTRQHLYFIPKADRRYTLACGNAHAPAPVSQLQQALSADVARLHTAQVAELGDLVPNPHYSASPEPEVHIWGVSGLLTVAVLLLAGGVGWWGYRRWQRQRMRAAQ